MNLLHNAAKKSRLTKELRPLMLAIDTIDNATLVLDQSQCITYANRAFTELFGYTLEEILGKQPTQFLVSSETASTLLQSLLQAAWENLVLNEETLLHDKSGREIWLSARVSSIWNKENHGNNLVIVFIDVTETKQIQALQRTILEAVASGLPLADVADLLCHRVDAIAPEVISSMLLVDSENRLHPLAAPRLPEKYTSALEGLLIGENAGSCGTAAYLGEAVCVTDISTDPRWERYKSMVLPLGLYACWSLPIKLRDGRIAGTFAFYYAEKRSPSRMHQELAFACLHLCMLAIESNDAKQKIAQLSHFDPLTGLPNRTSLYGMAGELLTASNSEEVSFFSLDLDHFKDINNTLGHSVGDRMLIEVAYRLQKLLQPLSIICRIAGDAFAIVIPNCGVARASSMADRILGILRAPIDISEFSLSITASIGISIARDNSDTPQAFVEQAVVAMRQAKLAGRACYHFYSPEMNKLAKDRLVLGAALRTALSNNSLRLEYQPKINLKTLKLTGVEALSRWTDEHLGEISPGRFIPLAEEINQIEVIGIWSLHEACRQMAEWRRNGLPIPNVSVNLAPVHFLNRNLPIFVKDLLREFHLPADCLTIEITESVMAGQSSADLETARELHAIGVALSIDDFGTGSSSLARLTQLPLKELKLDSSFIHQLEDDPNAHAVATAVISIGQSLGMTVVSEGVETEKQVQLLTNLGCPIAQGFFFGKSMPAHQLESWLLSN